MGNYGHFEHDADIGIVGSGKTVEEAFESAAKALFSIQSTLSEIRPVQKIDIDFSEDDVEYAFVTWLNRLIYEAQSRKIAFSEFRMEREDGKWHGVAAGEHWNDHMTRGVEVKGATLTGLSVKRNGNEWEARCIVDV